MQIEVKVDVGDKKTLDAQHHRISIYTHELNHNVVEILESGPIDYDKVKELLFEGSFTRDQESELSPTELMTVIILDSILYIFDNDEEDDRLFEVISVEKIQYN